jgi:hypothetical protein
MANATVLSNRYKIVDAEGRPSPYFMDLFTRFVSASEAGTVSGAARAFRASYLPRFQARATEATYPQSGQRRTSLAQYQRTKARRATPAKY